MSDYDLTRALLDLCGLRVLDLAQQASIFAFRRFCSGMLFQFQLRLRDFDYRDFDVMKQSFNNNPHRFVAYYQRRCHSLLLTKYGRHPLLEPCLIDKIIYGWGGAR